MSTTPPTAGTDQNPIPVPPMSIDVVGVADQELDPSNWAQLGAAGIRASGIIEHIIATLITGLANLVGPLIAIAASLFDSFLADLGKFFIYAQGQRGAGYYQLVGELMTDLTGIETDGAELYKDFSTGGRLAAMQALGAGLINALASEFAGETQVDSGQAWKVSPGSGIGGLPDVALSPEGGIDAMRAFMGFATSFAVREGNTDLLADYLPYGLGHWFKDFAEDFSKNVGLGRLGRVVFRPLLQIMAATPATWALNKQYRPKLLSSTEAVHGWITGRITAAEMQEQLARDGYSDANMGIVQDLLQSKPTIQQLELLRVTGDLTDTDEATWLQRLGYTQEVIDIIRKARDYAPARQASLHAGQHFVIEYLTGIITGDQLHEALAGFGALGQGKLLLTPDEIAHLESVAGALAAYPRRTLTPAQLLQAYIDSTITLQEYEDGLSARGYSQADVTILGIDALIKAKQVEQAAEKKAVAAAKQAASSSTTTSPAV